MNFTNVKKNSAGAMSAVFCQNFILEDEEFSSNAVIKEHMNEPEFWFELGKKAEEAMRGYLVAESQNDESYTSLPLETITFILNPRYRPYLVDVVIDFVTAYLDRYGATAEEDE